MKTKNFTNRLDAITDNLKKSIENYEKSAENLEKLGRLIIRQIEEDEKKKK